MSAKSNVEALKSILKQYPMTVGGETLYGRKPGLIWLAEEIMSYPGLADLIISQGGNGVEIGQLIRDFPGFVTNLCVKSLAGDGDEDEIRDFVRDIGPDEFIDLGYGVWNVTFPQGFAATKKKIAPLLAQFKSNQV